MHPNGLYQLQLLDRGCDDPAKHSALNLTQLADLADANDQQAALKSLDAELHHWQDGRVVGARQWISNQLEDLQHWAKGLEPSRWLEPIETLLEEGNTAMRWLRQHDQGQSINAILRQEAALMESQERELSSITGADLG